MLCSRLRYASSRWLANGQMEPSGSFLLGNECRNYAWNPARSVVAVTSWRSLFLFAMTWFIRRLHAIFRMANYQQRMSSVAMCRSAFLSTYQSILLWIITAAGKYAAEISRFRCLYSESATPQQHPKSAKCPDLRGDITSRDGKQYIFCKGCNKKTSYAGWSTYCFTHHSEVNGKANADDGDKDDDDDGSRSKPRPKAKAGARKTRCLKKGPAATKKTSPRGS